MHEAYQVSQLLKLTVQIESIAAYDENLLVGTRQGHLLMYRVVPTPDDKHDVQLMRYNKTFSKKAIQQLDVIPEYHLLVSLTDNIIQVHDINSSHFPVVHQAARTKGANIFTLDTKSQVSLTGEKSVVVRICVAVKRKLQLYYWKNNEFMKLVEDISLTDVPRALTWCQETLCVGFRGEYSLFELNGQQQDLFPTSSSRSSDPCIMKVSDTTFALGREMQTVLVNVKGDAEKAKALRWSDIPIAMAWDEPYTLGVLPESVEVQTLDPGGSVQTLENLPKARLITRCRQGLLYVASVSQVWCLHAVEISKQREMLLKDKQFQLALTLTMVSKETDEDKNEKIHQIQTLLAYDLFANKEFSKSMKEFIKLDTDPYDVIRLFPDLLPQQSNATDQQEASTAEGLTERELEDGLLALIEYLTEVRLKLQTETQATVNASGNLNDKPSSNKSTQQLLQIIDTTLLKCYLQTNDALVAPLLRLNHCHLAETERTLKKHGKHNELIILYQTKGQHRRALELLQREKSIDKTITYLQHLGSENMGLVIEFSDWVLQESPEDGLKIFTEDLAEVEALPRPRVLDFLLRSHPSLVIPYLEHVVHTWEDTNPLFHNALVHQYREQASGDSPTAHLIQKKLLDFLDTSKHYTPDTVLIHFPPDKLLEERAIILGRLGRHEQALFIYVRVLGDIPRAVAYCSKVYESANETIGEEVYVSLIKLILDPNSSAASFPTSCLSPITAQPDLETALQLLEQFASRINPLSALAIIPDNVHVSRIHQFLQTALHKSVQNRRCAQLLKGLLYAEHLQCQETRLHLQSQSVHITDLNVCPVCKKRFGNQSAFVRYPNGDVVHYSCQDRKL
ncbi:hypothetical protein ILUMI_05905 [Ignelater luminosus]|uniref:CNH domain-containing protein n=1 Tax=Ignelater luminosus TaxID=2038154 RepID=A0A8K0GJN5_IGNLU|nr:hypothetical protein ILUMI_05905 [Ignelater luminosus]